MVWEYGVERGPESFRSVTESSAQRLPNGNTLIGLSTNRRAIEVTQDKKIVWEYISPYRAGENDELIATLLEVVRLPHGKLVQSRHWHQWGDKTGMRQNLPKRGIAVYQGNRME